MELVILCALVVTTFLLSLTSFLFAVFAYINSRAALEDKKVLVPNLDAEGIMEELSESASTDFEAPRDIPFKARFKEKMRDEFPNLNPEDLT